MEKKTTDRRVRTHVDNDGIIIFSLLQGQKKPRNVHTFGYGTRHKICLSVEGMGSGAVTMTAEQSLCSMSRLLPLKYGWPACFRYHNRAAQLMVSRNRKTSSLS